MNMTRQTNLDLWARTLLEDEYNDALQNKARGEEGRPSGHEVLDMLLSPREAQTPTLDVGCGSGQLVADYYLDPNPRPFVECASCASKPGSPLLCEECLRRREHSFKIKKGWMENLPFKDGELGRIICWGTFCFLRSPIEALMEANRALRMGGDLIFDVVLHSTMPLCQTVDGGSFLGHLALHGFKVVQADWFGKKFHRRLGIAAEKERDWDPRFFRMLQATQKPLNYVEERDWYIWGNQPI